MYKVITAILTLFLLSCGNQEEIDRLTKLNEELKTKLFEKEKLSVEKQVSVDRINFLKQKTAGFKAIMHTNMGNMTFKFFPEKAPLHVFTFITRAESGFYNGTKFHRIMKGFMIQGGSPSSKDNINMNDGTGAPLVSIPYEISGYPHKPGMLSAANIGNPIAGDGSQFFIMHGNAPHLDQKHTVFGEMIEGNDVLEKIANVQVYKENNQYKDYTANMPLKPVIIKKIEIVR